MDCKNHGKSHKKVGTTESTMEDVEAKYKADNGKIDDAEEHFQDGGGDQFTGDLYDTDDSGHDPEYVDVTADVEEGEPDLDGGEGGYDRPRDKRNIDHQGQKKTNLLKPKDVARMRKKAKGLRTFIKPQASPVQWKKATTTTTTIKAAHSHWDDGMARHYSDEGKAYFT